MQILEEIWKIDRGLFFSQATQTRAQTDPP